MSVPNYYEILEITPSADAEEVRVAARKQRRTWTNRQNHPNPDTRATAEKRVHLIAEAERVLLDPTARAQHDAQLAAQAAAPTPDPAPTAGGARDWTRVAWEYLAGGQVRQANAAAREATTSSPDNPKAWSLRAQTALALGDYGDAEFAISEALRLAPGDALSLAVLGDVHDEQEEWPQALAAYEKARAADPSNVYVKTSIARIHAITGNYDKAVAMLEAALVEHPGDTQVARWLTLVLSDRVTEHWSTDLDGSRVITNRAQLDAAKADLARIQALGVLSEIDEDVQREVAEVQRVVGRAETVRWFHSDNLLGYGVGIAVLLLFAFIIGNAGGLGVLIMLLCLAGVGGIGYLYYQRHHIPGWEHNRKSVPQAVVRSGVQEVTVRG